MRKWELIKQSQLLKIKSQILSKLFNEKYGLRLGEFKNTTGTERVKVERLQFIICNKKLKLKWFVILDFQNLLAIIRQLYKCFVYK